MGVSSFQGLRELSWWRITSLLFKLTGQAHIPTVPSTEKVPRRGAIVRITHYCMRQIGFSQQSNQQIPTLFKSE